MLIILAFVLLLLLPSPWSWLAFAIALALGIAELFAWNQTVKHRRRAVDPQLLVGRDAVVVTACEPNGQVRLDGEIWAARCDGGAAVGAQVRIASRDGLVLTVEPQA